VSRLDLDHSANMDADNCLCSDCASNDATLFCACSLPETILCDACFPKHSRSVSRQGHPTWPISLLRSYKNPRYFDRRETFLKVKKTAATAISEVDRAIEELNAQFTEIQATLNSLYWEKLAELQAYKDSLSREIPAALQEVELTLAEEEPVLGSQYGPVLRTLTEEYRDFRLFGYSLQVGDMRKIVTLRTFWVNPEELMGENYPVMGNGMVTFYSVISQTKRQYRVLDELKGSSIVMDGKGLFCIGGNPASVNTYVVDLDSWEVGRRANLSVPRFASGVIKANKRIWAFGGLDESDQPLYSCEKWSANPQKWTKAGQMQCSRAAFSPCSYKDLIYLLASWSGKQKSIETFNPVDSVFTLLPVSLPADFLFECGSVAFVVANELVLITDRQQIVRWKIEEKGELRVTKVGKGGVSLQQPLVLGSEVIWGFQGEIATFSLEVEGFL